MSIFRTDGFIDGQAGLEPSPAGIDPCYDQEYMEGFIEGKAERSRETEKLLNECRLALDDLIQKKPGIQGLVCGSTTLGNLRVELLKYKILLIDPMGQEN